MGGHKDENEKMDDTRGNLPNCSNGFIRMWVK